MTSPLFRRHLPLIILLSTYLPCAFETSQAQDSAPTDEHSLTLLLKQCDKLWKSDLSQLKDKFATHGFEWMSSDRNAIRSVSPELLMLDEKVGETVIRGKEGTVHRVDVSIYNRGDRGSIDYSEFSQMKNRWQKHISEITKTKPEPLKKAKNSAVKLKRILWYTQNSAILLETSSTQGQAQFMRLRMAPKPKGAFYLGNSSGRVQKTRQLSDLRRNLKKTSTGDIFITDIPMVDQGPKGYCAVASAERVFRYYGLETDQHEMAELARTSSAGGTSPTLMYDALKEASTGAQLRVFSIIAWDTKKFMDDIKAYNRTARKKGLSQAPEDWRRIRTIGQIYDALDPQAYKQHKADRGNYFKSFNNDIEKNINAGIPLFWGIRLGMYPEPEIPQAKGGHMRLIIGYNRKEKAILYTDSWGPGHELKRMPADQAYAITNGLFIIKPSR
ncbi:MAG: hypothetical protein L3J39_04195 [Verrucomicrobiales bacterium]|nr:hypothetical protein [Verrucomicrobiales bacterium]